jgi:hypothetical protein
MTATVIQRSIQRMVCTGCGAEANASCDCGVAYQPKSVRATEAIKAHPEKSDRAIAADLRTSPETVHKARRELTANQLAVGPRIGLDGKTRLSRQPRNIKDLMVREAAATNRRRVFLQCTADTIRKAEQRGS